MFSVHSVDHCFVFGGQSAKKSTVDRSTWKPEPRNEIGKDKRKRNKRNGWWCCPGGSKYCKTVGSGKFWDDWSNYNRHMGAHHGAEVLRNFKRTPKESGNCVKCVRGFATKQVSFLQVSKLANLFANYKLASLLCAIIFYL